MITFTSDVQPAPIKFNAFKSGTADAVKINGSETIMVTPTKDLITYTIYLGEESNSY